MRLLKENRLIKNQQHRREGDKMNSNKMFDSLLDAVTVKVMREAYEVAKTNTTTPDDSIFVAGAFLNVARLLYIEVLGEENARILFQNVVQQSLEVEKPTYH